MRIMSDLQTYMKFAIGVYGGLLYMFREFGELNTCSKIFLKAMLCGPCRVLKSCCEITTCAPSRAVCTCMTCLCPGHPGVVEACCCRWHEGAFFRVTQLGRAELIYASWINQVAVTPYCISVDTTSKTVIVAIRGSLSLEDALTDCLADDYQLSDLGRDLGFDGKGVYAHRGMIEAATTVLADLETTSLLDLLLNVGSVPTTHMIRVPHLHQDCRGFRLVITGHSLGAGVASVLAVLLRPLFPNLHAYAMSPPGGMFSASLATRSEAFITSVIVGKDIVPRLSFANMEHLKDQAMELIAASTQPKISILKGMVLGGKGRVVVPVSKHGGPMLLRRDHRGVTTVQGVDGGNGGNGGFGTLGVINEAATVGGRAKDGSGGEGGQQQGATVERGEDGGGESKGLGRVSVVASADEVALDVDVGLDAPGLSSPSSSPELSPSGVAKESGGGEDVDGYPVPLADGYPVPSPDGGSSSSLLSDLPPLTSLTTSNSTERGRIRINQYREDRLQQVSLNPTRPMYLPGRIVHLSEEKRTTNVKRNRVAATWASRNDFLEILVTPSAGRDHLPDRVESVIDRAWDTIRGKA